MKERKRWIGAAALLAALGLSMRQEPAEKHPLPAEDPPAPMVDRPETDAPPLKELIPQLLEEAGWEGALDTGGALAGAEHDTGTPYGELSALAWISVLNADEKSCVAMADSLDGLDRMELGCSHLGMLQDGEELSVLFNQDLYVQAVRMDGLLYARSDPMRLEYTPGEEVEAELSLPQERTGGLGVQIAKNIEGIEVVKVWPGTPADEMGLAEGDIIVEVDGQPTAEMGLYEFIDGMTGPVGSEVDFVLAGGDTGDLPMQLTRSLLDF
jgi:hypothetical protein